MEPSSQGSPHFPSGLPSQDCWVWDPDLPGFGTLASHLVLWLRPQPGDTEVLELGLQPWR